MDVRTSREAVALFADAERLQQAVSALRSHGFDHADLSFIAPEALEERPDARAGRLAADPETPRDAAATDTDVRQARVLGTGMAATIAGFAAAGFTVATGGVMAAVILATSAAAGGVGAIGALIGREIDRSEASYLDEQVARGGVLLWVRLPDAAAEQRAIEVLRRYSERVRIHEFPAGARDRTVSGTTVARGR